MTLPVFPVKQWKITFYTWVIMLSELRKFATIIPRATNQKDGVQRLLNNQRVTNIADFVKKEQWVIFPNSIIINIPRWTFNEKLWVLEIDPNGWESQIIDGQHRYEWAKNSWIDIPFIITCFLELPIKKQAEIFLKINSTQKWINPSLMYDLLHITKSWEDIEQVAIDLVYRLSEDPESPFFWIIKTTDARTKKIINSATLINPLIKILKSKWWVFASLEFDQQKMVLINYFNGIKGIFPEQWNNPDYILTKGIWINVFLNLLPDILVQSFIKQDTTLANVKTFFLPIKDEKFNWEEYSWFSSEAGYSALTNTLKAKMFK